MPRKPSKRPSLSGTDAAYFRLIGKDAASVFGKHNGLSTITVEATKTGARVTVSAELPPRPPLAPNVEPVIEFRAGLYQHYKGGYYQALGVAEHSETEEPLVMYVALDASQPGMRLRARPLAMWNDNVTMDGLARPRFRYCGLALPKL